MTETYHRDVVVYTMNNIITSCFRTNFAGVD